MLDKNRTENSVDKGLVNLIADEKRIALLKKIALDLPDITLNDRHLCDLELLATGVFSPLDGFMVSADYEAVINRMELQNGTFWPIPVCLDISEMRAGNIEVGQSVALRDAEGMLLAVMHIDDKWPVNRMKEANAIYRTEDPTHPGVWYLLSGGDYYIGGKIEVVELPSHFDFLKLRQTPREIRNIYEKLGWTRVVGFKTRHPIHRPQFEMTLKAMCEAKANLLILSTAGMAKSTDFDHYTRVRCHWEVIKQYPPNSYILNLLPLSMRLSGPRDALLDAIIARNFGCSHFIVGHDHASPGVNNHSQNFYESGEAKNLANELSSTIGIEILPFEEMVYLPFEDEYRPMNEISPGVQTISLSGTNIRDRVIKGKNVPDWSTFPGILNELHKAYPPPQNQGFTVFLTGLSGAGKSTLAKILYSRFLEIGDRPVTLLDGDIVRQNLSSELNFSKEHRDINVRRIGFVASEITKNRGIAICAPIAPYKSIRNEIRTAIETYGGFIQVHVATPLEECEKRDRKGMYAKARAGLIKGFTGIDDPYEMPENSELSIDTTDLTPNEAVQEILLFLSQRGYI